MGCSLVMTALLWALCAQTQISTTDRAPFVAEVLAITDEVVEISEEGQLAQLPLERLRRVSFAGGDGPVDASAVDAAGNTAQRTTLVDGSQLSYQQFVLQAGTAEFQLAAEVRLSLPVSLVHRVQFVQLSAAQLAQWQAISESRIAADWVVLIRSAEALEKLEGVVSAVTPEAVSFDFSGQTIAAPLAKLAGVRFFSGGPAVPQGTSAAAAKTGASGGERKLVGVVRDRLGNRWQAAQVQLARGGSKVDLELQCGAQLSLPLDQLLEIDFSSGSVLFLSELEPLKRESSHVLPVSAAIAGADNLFGPRSQDLQRPGTSALGPSLEFLGSGAVEYRIPADFSRLAGSVELRPSGSRFTPCMVTLKVDNQVIWQERLAETGKAWPVDVSIKPDGRMRIEVSAEGQTSVGDVVLMRDLRIVK